MSKGQKKVKSVATCQRPRAPINSTSPLQFYFLLKLIQEGFLSLATEKKKILTQSLFLVLSQDIVVRKEHRKFFTLTAKQRSMTNTNGVSTIGKDAHIFKKKNCQAIFFFKILVHL